jgi:hypothetical protein
MLHDNSLVLIGFSFPSCNQINDLDQGVGEYSLIAAPGEFCTAPAPGAFESLRMGCHQEP